MPSQKLVRCHIRRTAQGGADTERFVPLEIFGLWEYLMRAKHEFEIVKPLASLWLDMEDSPEAAYTESQFDRVTEVTAFVYSGRDEMFMRACRYFPTQECAKLKEIFLSHYRAAAGKLQTQVRERPGIWLHRDPALVAE